MDTPTEQQRTKPISRSWPADEKKQEDDVIKALAPFNRLIKDAADHLEKTLRADLPATALYTRIWKQARTIMAENQIYRFDEAAEKAILFSKYGDKPLGLLTASQWRFRKGVKLLTEFSKSGKMTLTVNQPRKSFFFDGELGQTVSEFLLHIASKRRLSRRSIRYYEDHVHLFFEYCKANGVASIEKIGMPVILDFLSNPNQAPVTKNTICAVRALMKYSYETGSSKTDLSQGIPQYKRTDRQKLPSVYQKEEIEKLLSSAKRDSPTEKRNYIVLLLAARLGLRAGDISMLRFQDVDWSGNRINITQSKTGRELSLPLLADIGNAIIDYLRNGRPKSDEPFIFLSGNPPFGSFATSGAVTQIVQRAILRAGICVEGRRFGAHALRHSLSFRLLQNSTRISVISEVLGHRDTDTTKRYYLRIDLESMKPCALEIEPVPSSFYQQLGGIFYDKET